MNTATWRVNRTDHAGQPMAPLDHTSKPDALAAFRQLRDSGANASLQQYDAFTGQWTNHEVDQ